MKKILSVVGSQRSYIQTAPVAKALRKYRKEVKHMLYHAGMPFDPQTSTLFYEDLQLPKPDFFEEVGEGSHVGLTARIMLESEKLMLQERPDLLLVAGDSDASLAAALVATKMGVPVAHIEAGLRCFDKTVPEEINRIVTDVVSDFLFVTEHSGMHNLRDEGMDDDKIFFVGNPLVDVLEPIYADTESTAVPESMGLEKAKYIVASFDKPFNVDDEESLEGLLLTLGNLSGSYKVIFPAHPHTRENINTFGLASKIADNLMLTDPMDYLSFLSLMRHAGLVITDSGSIQDETTYLGVQCITVSRNTERPVTIDVGTNQLVGVAMEKVEKTAFDILGGVTKAGRVPELWDGKAAKRIAEIIMEHKDEA